MARSRVGALGLFALLVVTSLGVATPARAGGWWNSLDPGASLWAPGLHVRADAGPAWFPSIEAADRATEDGAYYAYLLDDFDYDIVDRALDDDFRAGWWSLGDASTTQLGPVAFGRRDANLVRSWARFVVPDVAPGRYHLMFCNEGCTKSFADVIPTTVTVIEDPAVGELSRRVDRLRARADRMESSLRGKVWRLGRRVDRLAKTIDEQRAAASAEPPAASGGSSGPSSAGVPILLAAVALTGAAALYLRRRRSSPGP